MTCVKKVWDSSGYFTCGRQAKWLIDLGAPAKTPVCGRHAVKFKRDGKSYEPVPAATVSAMQEGK